MMKRTALLVFNVALAAAACGVVMLAFYAIRGWMKIFPPRLPPRMTNR
jgi:hypothetical protein